MDLVLLMAGYYYYTNLLLFQRSVYKQKFFSVTKLPNLINNITKQYRKLLARSLEHWGIAALFQYYGLVNIKKNTDSKGLSLLLFLAL